MITEMPQAGYTVTQFERLAGIPRKVGYALIDQGKVEAYRDEEGRLRISPYEAYYFVRRREEEAASK